MYNHMEFYQSSLISIGLNDQASLLKAKPNQTPTHWMVALEGETKKDSNYYLWRVSVYVTDPDGSFTWHKPYFSSKLHDCFHKAYEMAKDLEASGKQDKLYSIAIQEKIS